MSEDNYKDYLPVDCGFLDVIEHYATLKQKVSVHYNDVPAERVVLSRLATWKNIEGVEYLFLVGGLRIRLDHILRIGDYDSKGHCITDRGEEE